MATLNKVMLIGNLTRDPQLKNIPSGGSVCELGLAVNRRYRSQQGEDREEVCYVEVCFFGRLADVCSRCLRRGEPVFVEGRLRYESWTDRSTQKIRSRLSVIGENMQFLSRSTAEGRNGGASPAPGLPAPPSFSMSGEDAPISSPAEAAAVADRLAGSVSEENSDAVDGIPF